MTLTSQIPALRTMSYRLLPCRAVLRRPAAVYREFAARPLAPVSRTRQHADARCQDDAPGCCSLAAAAHSRLYTSPAYSRLS